MQYPCIDIYIYIYIYILSILLLSYGTDKENSKSQASLAHSHFLLTSMFDSAAMLQGEIISWLLLGIKGLR